MTQSFYKKEGLDFLYFNRPGTAYNDPNAFAKPDMMGTATRSQFYQGGAKQSVKPIEMIKSKTSGNTLLQQLWSERANKTLQQLNHMGMLLEQFELMGDCCFRIQDDTLPSLKKSWKEDRDETMKKEKHSHIQALKQFLELYQTYSI